MAGGHELRVGLHGPASEEMAGRATPHAGGGVVASASTGHVLHVRGVGKDRTGKIKHLQKKPRAQIPKSSRSSRGLGSLCISYSASREAHECFVCYDRGRSKNAEKSGEIRPERGIMRVLVLLDDQLENAFATVFV